MAKTRKKLCAVKESSNGVRLQTGFDFKQKAFELLK